jgi:hypothetical protein
MKFSYPRWPEMAGSLRRVRFMRGVSAGQAGYPGVNALFSYFTEKPGKNVMLRWIAGRWWRPYLWPT